MTTRTSFGKTIKCTKRGYRRLFHSDWGIGKDANWSMLEWVRRWLKDREEGRGNWTPAILIWYEFISACSEPRKQHQGRRERQEKSEGSRWWLWSTVMVARGGSGCYSSPFFFWFWQVTQREEGGVDRSWNNIWWGVFWSDGGRFVEGNKPFEMGDPPGLSDLVSGSKST